ARCGMNLMAYKAVATVTAVRDDMHVEASGLSGFADRFFRYGVLSFTSGAAKGLSADVDDHRRLEGADELTLWLPMAAEIAVGDTLEVTAGCDKRFSTCKVKFGNGLNFQGFPHIPGSDFSYGYADGETVHDGSPLYD
ncbi:MAG: phage BR0599 family protein, partial [Rhizobiales bacterium]|nr:phage BR0599 family protein [Hyphomicrobiales bacterium]